MNKPEATPVVEERLLVWLLCALAAAHVCIFSAVFPFFNPIDELLHFDVMVKYSNGHLPRGLEHLDDESRPYIVFYSSPEYYVPPQHFPGGKYPTAPWLLPPDEIGPLVRLQADKIRGVLNDETPQPPLYYVLTGLCWRLGRALKLSDAFLLYGIRFLNAVFVGALVWLGYLAARTLFPDRSFIRLGVAALLAFLPQSAFYSIENDVLSPVSFGLAFLFLLRWLRGDRLTFGLAAGIGLALAAAFLTKLSNLPLIAVAAAVIGFNACLLSRAGKFREVLPAFAALILCAVLPMAAWVARMKHSFGDYTGEAVHVLAQGWTRKPFSEWWHHPIFTPAGLWTFISTLLGSFWDGELFWHGSFLAAPALNIFYTLLSLCVMSVASTALVRGSASLTSPQRLALWFCLACVLASIVFLGFLSLPYDYQNCVRPSREHPYFSSGRLILGAAVPFFLLFVLGLDFVLGRFKLQWVRPAALAMLIVFMLAMEIVTDWPVFFSRYNWFHM